MRILDRRKILLVDNDREIVDLIELYLTGENYEIVKAYDGRECFKMLKENDISLLGLDIMMPRVDGLDVCKELRKESNIPIILVTAKTNSIDKVQDLSIGADDYITKPFHPLELVARIKAQMRRYIDLNPSKDDFMWISLMIIPKKKGSIAMISILPIDIGKGDFHCFCSGIWVGDMHHMDKA